jgi:hypothetical protein
MRCLSDVPGIVVPMSVAQEVLVAGPVRNVSRRKVRQLSRECGRRMVAHFVARQHQVVDDVRASGPDDPRAAIGAALSELMHTSYGEALRAMLAEGKHNPDLPMVLAEDSERFLEPNKAAMLRDLDRWIF